MKRFFAFSSLGTALVLLFFGVYLLDRLALYKNEIAALEEAGFPVSIVDLSTQPTAKQADATNQFRRLLEPLGAFESEMWEVYGKIEGDVDEPVIALFNELDAAYPTVYPLITEIVNAGHVGFKNKDMGPRELLDFQLEKLQKVRSCARVLDFKAMVLASQGKPDQAMQASVEILKLCRAFDKSPTFLAHLIRCACRGIGIRSAYAILSKHEITAESRDQLNAALDDIEASDEYRWALVSERAVGSLLLSETGTIPLALNGVTYLDLIKAELEQCGKEFFAKDLSFENGLLDSVMLQSLLPAMRACRLANLRIKSQVRGLRIVNALTQNLESIDKQIDKAYLMSIGVPEPMTVDTMTGESMKVKRMKADTDEHWVVYSVGENLIDDNGNRKDFAVGPE